MHWLIELQLRKLNQDDVAERKPPIEPTAGLFDDVCSGSRSNVNAGADSRRASRDKYSIARSTLEPGHRKLV